MVPVSTWPDHPLPGNVWWDIYPSNPSHLQMNVHHCRMAVLIITCYLFHFCKHLSHSHYSYPSYYFTNCLIYCIEAMSFGVENFFIHGIHLFAVTMIQWHQLKGHCLRENFNGPQKFLHYKSVSPKAHLMEVCDDKWKKLSLSSCIPCTALSYGVKRKYFKDSLVHQQKYHLPVNA